MKNYIVIFLLIVSTTLNIRLLISRNESKITDNRQVGQLNLLANSYINLSKTINLSPSPAFSLYNANGDKQNVNETIKNYDYCLFFSETNCMECLKNIKKNILDKTKKRIGIIGKYDRQSNLLTISKRLGFKIEDVYYTSENIITDTNILNLNIPFLFHFNPTTSMINLSLLPIKEINIVQETFLKNENNH